MFSSANESKVYILHTTEDPSNDLKPEDMDVINRTTTGLLWFAAVLSLLTFVYGLISWTLHPKWRHFRNYVFQNITFSGLMFAICPLHVYFTNNMDVSYAFYLLFTFFVNVFIHWLVVATTMFYIDLFEVFNNVLKRRFLISTIFAWVFPVIVLILYKFAGLPPAYITAAETFLNFILYLRLLCSLYHLENNSVTRQQTCQIVLFSTLAFLATGFLLYFPMFMAQFNEVSKKSTAVVTTFLFLITLVCIDSAFIVMKSNIECWKQYRNQRTQF